uniref:MATH domain-containing protein n=1 Tax=Fagus sylvatica TaxID=28930 RepID=A0A2N9H9T9_FAGSY
MNGPTDHISVYLEIVDIEKYCLGWEVYASFKLFVFDQKRDQFVTIQDADGEIRRFHDVKTEWGFNKFLSLDSFNCHCNGYLVNDCCVFGAEVFVHERSGKREFLSMIKDPPNGVMTWKLENFSALNKAAYYSQVFAIGDLKWKLLLYPKGISDGVPKAISLFLCSCDCLDHCFQSEHKYFAEFKLRIRDQINNNHVENSGKHWFSNSLNEWGFSKFLSLTDLQDYVQGVS